MRRPVSLVMVVCGLLAFNAYAGAELQPAPMLDAPVEASSGFKLEPGSGYGSGQGWSSASAETVGLGSNVFTAQFGFPGLSLSLLHGLSPTVDLGGIFSVNYGVEGDTGSIHPELKAQGVVRIMLAEVGNLKFGLEFAPGLLLFFPGNTTFVGMTFPGKFVVGIPVAPNLIVNAGLNMPMWVVFGNGDNFLGNDSTFIIPILFGGGLEYFVDQHLALTFDLHMGPAIVTSYGGSYFDLNAMFGVALKL